MAEWVAIALTLLGSLAMFFRAQQKGEDSIEAVSKQIAQLSVIVERIDKTSLDMRVEVAEIRAENRARTAQIDERHGDTVISLEELKGDTKRHGKEITELKVWQSGADERIRYQRPRGESA